MDYAALFKYQSRLQAAVDSAALAAAKELTLSSADETTLRSVAETYVFSNSGADSSNTSVETVLDKNLATIEVTARKTWTPMFMQYIDNSVLPIVVSAKAQLKGTGKICVVGLNKKTDKTLKLEDKARLVGDDCGVYSNSTHESSMEVGNAAEIKAQFICSAGGIKGYDKAIFDPTPVVDCPPIGDPLAARKPPKYSGCLKNEYEIKGGNVILEPGVYCGGLKIVGGAIVEMKPGVYVIKDKKFEVDDNSFIKGENVGIYLTGDGALLDIKPKSSFNLTAPKTGAMAGILIWEDRNSKEGRKHKISSNDARVLLGTIYLPRGELVVDSNGPVADQSAYTALISNTLFLKFGPTLVLNSNYDATDVPVPETLMGGKAFLVK